MKGYFLVSEFEPGKHRSVEVLYADEVFRGSLAHLSPHIIIQVDELSPSQVLVDGQNYLCKSGHTASNDNKPGVGADWQDVWEVGGDEGITWVSGIDYIKGNQAFCQDFKNACNRNDVVGNPKYWAEFEDGAYVIYVDTEWEVHHDV